MPRSCFVLALCLAVLASSCGPKHYRPEEIVDLPDADRDILFGLTSSPTLRQTEVFRTHQCDKIKWSGDVDDIRDSGNVFFPIGVVVRVKGSKGGSGTTCIALFGGTARSQLVLLQKGDKVTIAGWLGRMEHGDLNFGDCELIRAERDGKQIYPPPEEKAQPETEKKP